MDPADLAYAAGYLDGEGCFSCDTNGRIKLICSTSHRPTIEWLYGLFGGIFMTPKRRPDKPHWKPMYVWAIADLGAEQACRALLPYLREKRRQAELMLKMRETFNQPRQGRCVHPDVRASRMKMRQELKDMKRGA